MVNEKKTEWMKLGEAVSKDNKVKPPLSFEKIVVKGTEINKVAQFKFLGYQIKANNSNSEHLKRRKTLAMAVIGKLNDLGLNNENLAPEVKGTLFQTFFRSRLIYGLENSQLTRNDINELMRLEGVVIKRSFNLSNRSQTKPLLEIMKISSLEEAISKRQYSFMAQLIRNPLTRKLIMERLEGSTFTELVNKLNIDRENDEDEMEYARKLHDACLEKTKEMDKSRKQEVESELAKVVRFLLKNRSQGNDDALRYLIHGQNRIVHEPP